MCNFPEAELGGLERCKANHNPIYDEPARKATVDDSTVVSTFIPKRVPTRQDPQLIPMMYKRDVVEMLVRCAKESSQRIHTEDVDRKGMSISVINLNLFILALKNELD